MRHAKLPLACLPALLLALPATGSAQTSQDPDLLGVTCGEFLTAARIADPGKNPTTQRQAQAVDAQDALADAMLWVHGYLTGRAGPSAAPAPLTRAWMADYLGKLANACTINSADGKMRLAEAATKL